MAESETAPACVPNIGPGQRRRRVRIGVLALLAALVFAAVLLVTGAPRLVRLGLFPWLVVAAYGFFQARGKT